MPLRAVISNTRVVILFISIIIMTVLIVSVLPNGALGKAIHYALRYWKKLTWFVENGSWPIDNNPAEMLSDHLLLEEKIGYLAIRLKVPTLRLCFIV